MVLLLTPRPSDAGAIAAAQLNAGATVTGRVSLTSTWWTCPGRTTAHLLRTGPGAPGQHQPKDANGILGEAPAKALTANDDSSRVLMDMLFATVDKSGTPFISVDSTPTAAG